MKKIILSFMTLIMLTACSTVPVAKNSNKLSIVTTIFPEYDWVCEILGDKAKDAEVTMLLDNKIDLHSYQPTADDIIKISTCDMFVYVGGESDGWAEAAIKGAANKDMVVINLLDALGDSVKEEEFVEGMEHEHDHNETEELEKELDEHVWLSLKNAKTLCSHIAGKLGKMDAVNAETYTANANAYISRLDALDLQYKSAIGAAAKKALLFGDRFPFRYLADDYNLDYYAAFSGCSAETEASFETVAFLAKKVDELGLSCVMTMEGTNHKIAETVIQNTKDKNQKILSLNSMQSVTSADVKNGASYISIMENNLELLKEALN